MSIAETTIASAGDALVGPLEARHLESRIYRNAADSTRLTSTHWHIAWANGLGWGFDGMDGAILALVAPLLMKEFAIDLGAYRSGVQIALFVSIVGLYLWPWLADKFGRRNILALNIAVFSLAMPLVALSPGWGSFVLIYSIVRFALNGEWAVGSMLVAETWPARLRGLVLSVDRSAWGVGAALAGGLVTFVVTEWGWLGGLSPSGGDRSAGGLCPAVVPRITLLGAHAGPQGAHPRAAERRLRAR